MIARVRIVSLSLSWLLFASVTRAQVDARMLQNPDVSQTHIVFSYAGDLWVVPKQGGTALKLSSPAGQELFPHFSPDGSRIAYSANYDGNLDVYVVPTMGGVPTRVTHHGMWDRLVDWYPDGKSLLYASSMHSGRQRFSQFFRVPATGGFPEQLAVPFGEFAAIAADGKTVAYTPNTQAFRTWKRYRGGWAPDIWTFDLAANTARNLTEDPSNDEFPMWHGTTLYFLSDRGPENRANIWSLPSGGGPAKQITKFADFDVHFPAIGPSEIVFEAGGVLYLMSLADETYQKVDVALVTDKMTLLPRAANASGLIDAISLSSDGKRAIFGARGEVFSVPAEHGPVINLTQTSGVAERYPAWSPDGKRVAYWSDASGEYELTIRDFANPNAEQKLTSYGPGFRYRLWWSPDSKMIAFIDQAMKIRIHDVDKKKTIDVDRGLWMYDDDLAGFAPSWSPDSRWLAYRKDLENRNGAIALFDTKENKAHQVTSGYYHDALPSFDPDGKYLFFATNRSFTPVYSDVDWAFIYPNTTHLAVATLSDDVMSPMSPRDDSTSVANDKKDEEKDDKNDKDKKKEAPKETKVTIAGFEDRVVILPPKPGNIGRIRAVSGKVVFHRLPNTGAADEESPVMYYDLAEREEKTIVDDADYYQVSANGEKIIVGKDDTYYVVDLKEDQKLEKKMPSGDLAMTVDPRAEWKQIFNDVWRFERDYFYDPGMHGVDWPKMRTQYGKLLDDAVTRWDVNFVIGELIAELNASHTYRGGGDEEEAKEIEVGYLGVDWELANGAYRIKKIIRGAAWDTEVRSPLDMSGIDVDEGDYVLAVNGQPLDVSKGPWAAFAGLAKKPVVLTVNSKPSMDGARSVLVETLVSETRLRHLAWIEANRKRVDEATDGKIGYVYVPSTGRDGQSELVRQFAAQFHKQGLIIDERFNSGGQIPDRFVELLDRKPLAFWAVRDGRTWQWPPIANFGPKVMLINGWSGSGGDAFPDYFRKAGVGPLVGTRTWGGLIGITGAPSLVDGGAVTVPTFRMYDPDGTWFREGHGVDPDIEVKEDYTQLAKGIDVQLERGIQEVLRLLAASPSPMVKQPAFEKR
ncbi:MAG: PDZ domain-containing protein [Candidatus Latescibacteria bacterium]|nr:PDZ domain-containing protein [Candidatus Latescibacterota bacterium]